MQKKEEYDFSKLIGRIKEKGYTQEAITGVISRNPCTFSQKINNKGTFTATEIDAMCRVLEIEKAEIGVYFFTQKVQKVGIYQGMQPV